MCLCVCVFDVRSMARQSHPRGRIIIMNYMCICDYTVRCSCSRSGLHLVGHADRHRSRAAAHIFHSPECGFSDGVPPHNFGWNLFALTYELVDRVIDERRTILCRIKDGGKLIARTAKVFGKRKLYNNNKVNGTRVARMADRTYPRRNPPIWLDKIVFSSNGKPPAPSTHSPHAVTWERHRLRYGIVFGRKLRVKATSIQHDPRRNLIKTKIKLTFSPFATGIYCTISQYQSVRTGLVCFNLQF